MFRLPLRSCGPNRAAQTYQLVERTFSSISIVKYLCEDQLGFPEGAGRERPEVAAICRHLVRLCIRDALIAAPEAHCPDLRWVTPQGGIYLRS